MPRPGRLQAEVALQPTFERVVYLDRATPEQLAFQERRFEQLQTQQNVAPYRLKRSVI
jgi:hypothetical protein